MKKGVSLYGKGELTVKQPIFRSDLVDGVMASLHDPAALGQIYEAVGPQRLTQKELLTYMYALTTRLIEDETFHIKELMIDPEAFVKAFIAQKIKIGNLNVFHSSSLDRLERDSVSDTSEGFPEITELGVKLHSIEDKIPWEVQPFDLYAYYHYETPEEKHVVRKPHYLSLDEVRESLDGK